MADDKRRFPTQADIRAFLLTLRPKADAELATAVGRSFHTVEKWYRARSEAEMSAVNLLRVVVALHAEARFAEWLSGFSWTASKGDLRRVAEPPPLPIYDATPSAADAARGRKGTAKGR